MTVENTWLFSIFRYDCFLSALTWSSKKESNFSTSLHLFYKPKASSHCTIMCFLLIWNWIFKGIQRLYLWLKFIYMYLSLSNLLTGAQVASFCQKGKLHLPSMFCYMIRLVYAVPTSEFAVILLGICKGTCQMEPHSRCGIWVWPWRCPKTYNVSKTRGMVNLFQPNLLLHFSKPFE